MNEKECATDNLRLSIYESAKAGIATLENETLLMFDLRSKSTGEAEQVAAREAYIYGQVCAEKEGDKPKFSNDGARKAEAAVREEKDIPLISLRESLKQSNRDIAVKSARIEAISNSIKLGRDFLHGGS